MSSYYNEYERYYKSLMGKGYSNTSKIKKDQSNFKDKYINKLIVRLSIVLILVLGILGSKSFKTNEVIDGITYIKNTIDYNEDIGKYIDIVKGLTLNDLENYSNEAINYIEKNFETLKNQ